MKKLRYSAHIHAPATDVFRSMLGLDDIATYEEWTAEFNPTSTYRGNWDEGSKILFLGTGENGEVGGMVSEIAEHIPGRFISIRHVGIYDGGQEITSGPAVEAWAGGYENYTFEETDGVTTVTVEIDITEDYEDYFEKTWPVALDKLKELVEGNR